MNRYPLKLALPVVLLGGLAGGAAEIAWVMLYAALTSLDASVVAHAIATTFVSILLADRILTTLGIVIHFTLSLGLALGFVYAISDRLPRDAMVPAAVAALAVVWGVNFLIVLPIVNPEFMTLLPVPVALASKLFFGAAMGWTIRHLSCRNLIQVNVFGPGPG